MAENKANDFLGLPDLDDWLDLTGRGNPVEVDELSHIKRNLSSKLGFTDEEAERVLSLFFQEIRNLMLRGKTISINNFGSFFVSSPKTTGNKKKTFPKFKPSKNLLNRIKNAK